MPGEMWWEKEKKKEKNIHNPCFQCALLNSSLWAAEPCRKIALVRFLWRPRMPLHYQTLCGFFCSQEERSNTIMSIAIEMCWIMHAELINSRCALIERWMFSLQLPEEDFTFVSKPHRQGDPSILSPLLPPSLLWYLHYSPAVFFLSRRSRLLSSLSSRLLSALSSPTSWGEMSFSTCNPYWHAQHYAAVLRQKPPDRTVELAWLAFHVPPFFPSSFPFSLSAGLLHRSDTREVRGNRSTMTSSTWHPASQKEHVFIKASGENASNARLGKNS